MRMKIDLAKPTDAGVVVQLIRALLIELSGGTEDLDPDEAIPLCKRLLEENSRYLALLASSEADQVQGVLTAGENAAVYAGGRFGIINELYIIPSARSLKIGKQLIDAAAMQGLLRGWRRLEVGTPELPRWEASVRFYLRAGFVEIGPRLKLLLSLSSGEASR